MAQQAIVSLIGAEVIESRIDFNPQQPVITQRQRFFQELKGAVFVAKPGADRRRLRLADVKSAETYKAACYLAPAEFDSAMGTLATMSIESQGDDAVRVPTGEVRARHFICKTDKGVSHLWLHPQLNVPVRGEFSGMAFVLTALEVAAPPK